MLFRSIVPHSISKMASKEIDSKTQAENRLKILEREHARVKSAIQYRVVIRLEREWEQINKKFQACKDPKKSKFLIVLYIYAEYRNTRITKHL